MVRRIADMVITLVLFGPPLLFAVTYTGLYQWVAELQLAAMNEYYEMLTFLLTLVIWLALCGLIWKWINKFRGKDVSATASVRKHDSLLARQLPAIVIVTAYDQHAVEAFRLEASCTYTPEIVLVGGQMVTIRVSHWGIVERYP